METVMEIFLQTALITFLVLSIALIIYVSGGCKFGHHKWYTSYNSGTYKRTGPLPGESTTHNGLGQGGYRYERHCLCCYKLEYSKDGVWTEFKLPEGKTLFNNF